MQSETDEEKRNAIFNLWRKVYHKRKYLKKINMLKLSVCTYNINK